MQTKPRIGKPPLVTLTPSELKCIAMTNAVLMEYLPKRPEVREMFPDDARNPEKALLIVINDAMDAGEPEAPGSESEK